MENRARQVLSLILFACLLPVAASADRVTVSMGHAGAVRAEASSPSGEFAFTGGDDGKLIIWDLAAGAAFAVYQIDPNPITAIAVRPTGDEVVVLAQRGVTSGALVALNWRTGEEIFRHEVEMIPSCLTYSPAGSYIVYAMPAFRSLYFLSADDGTQLPLLNSGFGAASFVQIAQSERNVMAYLPSRGELVYFRVSTGEELGRFSTVSRLRNVTVVDTDTRRYLAAADGGNLVVIDNYTGEMKAEYPVSPILGITYSPESGLISVLTEQLGHRATISFTYSSERLRRSSFAPQLMGDQVGTYAAVGSGETLGYLSGDATGQVVYYAARTGRRTLIGSTPLTEIDALALTDGRLHLLTDNRVVTIASDFFAARGAGLRATSIRSSELEIPDASLDGVTADGNQLLLWGSDGDGAAVWRVAPPFTDPQVIFRGDASGSIGAVRPTVTTPIVVLRDGTIIQLGNLPGVPVFEYSVLGAQDALWDPDVGVVAAKTRTSAFDTSLVVVDMATRETLPIATDAFLTSRVALDDRSMTLYSLSLVGSQSAPTTRLARHSGRSFGRTETLAEMPGEYPAADIVWDAATNALITSFSESGVLRYSGNAVAEFQPTAHLADQLVLFSSLLVARNSDGTATIWDARTREQLFDIYMVGSSDWLAVSLEGTFLSSSRGVERYLHHYRSGRSRLSLADFRTTLPFRR